jgi:hypothetical protein
VGDGGLFADAADDQALIDVLGQLLRYGSFAVSGRTTAYLMPLIVRDSASRATSSTSM